LNPTADLAHPHTDAFYQGLQLAAFDLPRRSSREGGYGANSSNQGSVPVMTHVYNYDCIDVRLLCRSERRLLFEKNG
jgi:hypothetical protein